MFHKDGNRRRTWKGRAFSLFLAAVLLLGSVPGFVLPSSAHWADPYLDQLVDWGVMRADQTDKPDAPLTRAEFMAIINRAYGYREMGEMPFEDVSEGDWFYDDVAIAYNAGYMKGTSKTTASPNAHLTREQAVCILGRNMMMKETPGEDMAFTDSRSISGWARGMVKTAVNQYIIGGFPDDSFRPKDDITKGQMAVLVTRCVGSPVNQSGTHELGSVFGNVTVTAPNVTLRNTTVSGDLYISGGVGLGGIKLENVDVLGRIVVSGTGESESGSASVIMRNVNANELLVDNMQKKYVTVRADGITEIPKTTVRTNAYLEDNNTDKKGLLNISLEGNPGTRLDLAGRIKEVVDKTPDSIVQVAKGTVAKLTVDEAATNSTVQINRNARVKELNLDVATTVTGEGDVDKLNINAPGSVVSMLPDDIYIRPGINGSINGGVMDSDAAEESSLDPRLLAGYPAAKDISPTGFRADFSGNKKGTVYWAVSAITDGSIGADNLISPPSYGSKALRGGSVGLPAGDTVGSTQVSGLSVGGSYYLSAVLVDARNQRSPVKVISFSTPDNTVPAFGEGYPYMSKISKNVAQVTVMPTKSCKLYYALLPQGAQAPTAADMKAAAVVGNLGYGVKDVTKNTEEVFTVNDQTLEELKNYVLYLWLTDVDGANSSAVTSLPVAVPDETPPVVSMPVQTASTGNSVTLSSSMNEPGTIFWAVVAMDTNYPLPNLESEPLNKDNILDAYGNAISSKLESGYAKLCVESGRGSLVKGSAAVSAAGTDVTINVSGRLEPETTYRLFYVGKDAVGNYSVEVKMVEIKTADTSGPIVKQYFRNATSDDKTENPLANDDVVLDFNEPITVEGSKELLSLYEMAQGNGANKAMAQKELQEKLQKNFILHEPDRYNPNQLIADVTGGGTKGRSWIDYSKVVIQKSVDKPGHIEVVFKNGAAIQLKSDTTYYFELRNVRDDAEPPKNPAVGSDRSTTLTYRNTENTEHSLKQFSTTFASVNLGDYKEGTGALTESEYPVWHGYVPEVKDENGNVTKPAENQPGSTTESLARVDAAFFVQPQSTEGVEDKYFDIAFFAGKRINYDLYYRIVDTATNQVIDIEAEANKDYVLPGAEAKREEETHGWVYLGEGKSPTQSRTEDGKTMFSSSVFNGMLSSQNKFPPLKTLKQGWAYQFAISVTKIGNSDSWGTWCEKEPPINIDIHVMTGGTSDLRTYLPTDGAYTPGSITANGSVKSIGTPQPLSLTVVFSDTDVPVFEEGPTFQTNRKDSSIEDINFSLGSRRGSTLYYRIVPVKEAKNFPVTIEVKEAVGAVAPSAKLNNGVDSDADSFKAVVKAQTDKKEDPGKLTYYQVVDPNGNVQVNIRDTEYAPNVKYGSIEYTQNGGIQTSPMHRTGDETDWELEPGTEYYAYLVLLPASGVINSENPPQVYVYYFETDTPFKPLIDLVDDKNGAVNIRINYPSTAGEADRNNEANLNWALFQRGDGEDYLGGRWIDIPSEITGYSRMTMLDALETIYSASTAFGGSVPSDTEYGTACDGYTVFDVFATDDQKKDLVTQIVSTNSVGQVNSNTLKTNEMDVTSGQVFSADWKTGAKLKPGETIETITGLFIVAAHNERSEPGRSDWHLVDSFKILRPVRVTTQAAPTLLNTNGNATGSGVIGRVSMGNNSKNDPTLDAQITLTFDSGVYWRYGGTDYMVIPERANYTGSGDSATVGVLTVNTLRQCTVEPQSGSGPFTAFTINITGLPMRGGKQTFTLLGSPGNIARKKGNDGGFISVEIESGYKHIYEQKDKDGNVTVPEEEYYQPKITVTNFGFQGAAGPVGYIEGVKTDVDENGTTPPAEVGPPVFTSIDGTISGEYDPTNDEFTITADTLDLLFTRPLYWKETDSSTSPIYKIVNGSAEPNDTSKEVGIQYTKLANDPTVTMTPSGGLYQLKFEKVKCGLSGTRFTLLNYGKIYAQDGTYGTKTSGITIDISLGEEVYDNNKGAYFRTPTITVTYDGGQKSKTGEPIEVRKPSITVTPSTLTLKKDETKTLTANANNGPTGSTVEWSSNNTAVATVDSSTGEVTGVSASSAPVTITATYKDSSGKELAKATATVTVVPAQVEVTIIPPTGLSASGSNKGAQIQLTVEVKLDGVVDKTATVTWTSSDETKATVSSSGEVKLEGNKGDTFTITATYTYPNSTVTGSDSWRHSIIETVAPAGGLKPIPQ